MHYAELAELAGELIHEIKNRAGTLAVNLQLLGEDFQGPQSPRERRAHDRVERLQSECQRLVDVANDFLRFARVKELERSPTDLAELVDELADFFAPTAKTHNVALKSYIPAGLPAVSVDRSLFKQALLNLMLNAQQAMPQGGELTFQATVVPAGRNGEPPAVELLLIDTGKGMTPEVLARAFTPFWSGRPGGTGLGLPTARKIVEAHGGTISAESEPGKGTKFTIRLPLAPSTLAGSEPLAVLNGERMPLAQARVSVLDRGFLFGDGVYEVLRVYGGRPWLADEHFARLGRSLEAIRIAGVDLERLRRWMAQTIAAGPFREALVYIQVTRGQAPRGHAFPAGVRPLELLWVQEIGDPYDGKRDAGVAVTLQPDLRWARCDIKSVNLLGNVLALQAARETGCAEAILVRADGSLSEGSHTSLFGVRGGTLITAPNGPEILPGVTRKLVLDFAGRLGIPVQERALHRDELGGVDELFLSGTTAEVLPVVSVDGRPVRDGKPGPVTRRFQQAYNEAVQKFLSG
jgi:D-alanine transaminase